MAIDDDLNKRLIEIFSEEGREFVSDLEENLRFLDPEQDVQMLLPIIGEIFRVIHSLKASVATLGYVNMRDYLHVLENLLDRIREEDVPITEEIVDLLFSATDPIKEDMEYLIVNVSDITEPKTGDIVETLKKYATADTSGSDSNAPSSVQELGYYQIIFRPHLELLESGTDPLMLMRELNEIGEVLNISCQTEMIPHFEEFSYFKMYLSWELILKTNLSEKEVNDTFIFVSANSTVKIENITSRYGKDGTEALLENKKVGEILLERGQVSEDDIISATEKQEKIGKILVEEKKVAPAQLDKALKDQEKVKKAAPTTIRVDILKLDMLVNLIGELVISESRLRNIAEELNQPTLMRPILAQCDETARIIQDLQNSAMNIRMIPVDTIFTQFHRLVRDLSKQQGKSIRLVLTGQETELDKNIIEKINNPLKHIVRNSIDHGVESAEERAASGKSAEAIIQLKASQREGGIYIEISDDGKGLDRDRILAKAIEKGLIQEGADVTEDEINMMIFNPGFSTAEQVTDISGRGVGMDVVRRSITDLHGEVSIKTEKGVGTTFTIKLPLTLAVIEGLIFEACGQKMIIPLASVDEVLSLKPGEIKTIERQGEYINVRGVPHTVVRLSEVLGVNGKIEKKRDLDIVLNINVDNKKFSLMIDEIVGQQQVVLKSLEDNFKKVDGFLGSTILGDGSIATIIDANEIVELFKSRKKTTTKQVTQQTL